MAADKFSALNLVAILQKPSLPTVRSSGHYEVDHGARARVVDLRFGDIWIWDRTALDSLAVYRSRASLRFADGRMLVDSLACTRRRQRSSPPARSECRKASRIHYASGRSRLAWRLALLPPALGHTLLGEAATVPDSLSGTASLTGTAIGTLDTLHVIGRLVANDLYMNDTRAKLVTASFYSVRTSFTRHPERLPSVWIR